MSNPRSGETGLTEVFAAPDRISDSSGSLRTATAPGQWVPKLYVRAEPQTPSRSLDGLAPEIARPLGH